jgi:PKD repeat protein
MGTDTDAQIPNNSYFFNPLTVKWENLNTQPGFENGAFLIRAKGTRTGGGGSNQNPVAVATASKSQASINESITFNGSQSYDNDGQISQYFWEFGDGNSSTQPIVSHSYSNSGTYNIKLTVTDNLGATGTATGQIIISGGGGGNQNPVAVATASKSQASINESISFDGSQSYDNDGQISQYLWEFGDGNSSTQAMATHSYSNSGTYNIKLTVTDNLGAKGTATGQIVIGGSNQNLVTANPTSGTIAPGGSQTITLTLDAQNLDVGSYTGQVSISTNGGNITIPIDYLVNVEKISSLSNEFTLSQNYPNPFNPSTVIEFSLPYSSEVSLKIYDMLGKEVVNLLEEQKVAGQYRVSFDGSSLSSGIYFYKLEADNFRASKKMLLIK